MSSTQFVAIIHKADVEVQADGSFKHVKRILGWIPINYLGVNSANYDKALSYKNFLSKKQFKGLDMDAVTINEEDLDSIMHFMIETDDKLPLLPIVVRDIITKDWNKYQSQFVNHINNLGYGAAFKEFAYSHPIFNPSQYHKIIDKYLYLDEYVMQGITWGKIVRNGNK